MTNLEFFTKYKTVILYAKAGTVRGVTVVDFEEAKRKYKELTGVDVSWYKLSCGNCATKLYTYFYDEMNKEFAKQNTVKIETETSYDKDLDVVTNLLTGVNDDITKVKDESLLELYNNLKVDEKEEEKKEEETEKDKKIKQVKNDKPIQRTKKRTKKRGQKQTRKSTRINGKG